MGFFQAVFGRAIAHISEINTDQHTGRQMRRDEGWVGEWRMVLKHSVFNENPGPVGKLNRSF